MKRIALGGLIATFVVQIALAAWLVADRERLLAQETVVILEATPLDPRDPLRGEYVILGYAIQRVAVEPDRYDAFTKGGAAYVTLEQGDPYWTATGISLEPPREGVFLAGTVPDFARNASRPPDRDGDGLLEVFVDYGIDAFFVPEGEGAALERMRNDGRISVDVAVAGDGQAALKALRIDGEVAYAVSLF